MKVKIKKNVAKCASMMPIAEKKKFVLLIRDLHEFGPVLKNWNNYGILKGSNTHHCHLSHKWVACWIETEKGIELEVVYVGSRESAPYAKH